MPELLRADVMNLLDVGAALIGVVVVVGLVLLTAVGWWRAGR